MEIAILLLMIGGVILTIGDILMKKWVGSSNGLFFILGLGIYLIGLILLAFSFKHKNIAVASVMLIIFNVISLSLVSYFYFKETLSEIQIIGITLGIVSVIVLELS